jgi:hypothetical protein
MQAEYLFFVRGVVAIASSISVCRLMTGFIAHLYDLLLHFTNQLHDTLCLLSSLLHHLRLPSQYFLKSRLTAHSECQNSTEILKVKVTLRLTVSQSVSLGVEPHLGLMTYSVLFDS